MGTHNESHPGRSERERVTTTKTLSQLTILRQACWAMTYTHIIGIEKSRCNGCNGLKFALLQSDVQQAIKHKTYSTVFMCLLQKPCGIAHLCNIVSDNDTAVQLSKVKMSVHGLIGFKFILKFEMISFLVFYSRGQL